MSTGIDDQQKGLTYYKEHAHTLELRVQELEQTITDISCDSEYEGGVQFWIKKHDIMMLQNLELLKQLSLAIAQIAVLHNCLLEYHGKHEGGEKFCLYCKALSNSPAEAQKLMERMKGLEDVLEMCRKCFITLEAKKGYSTEVPPNIVLRAVISISSILSTTQPPTKG